MKNTDDTSAASGAVPRICRAGRSVCAVVCSAPATIPSTSSRCSIIVPTVIGSASWSRAMSGVIPLCRRTRPARRRTGRSSTAGSMTSSSGGSVSPSPAACADDVARVRQQDAVGDAQLVADGRRPQRAGLGTLGQHDALAGLACGRWPAGGGTPAGSGAGRAWPSGTPASHCGSSAWATAAMTCVGPLGVVARAPPGRCREGSSRSRSCPWSVSITGRPGRGRRLAQFPHPRVGRLAQRQQQAGKAGAVHRGQRRAQDDLVAIARHDDQPALLQQRQDARHGLGADDHVLHPAVGVALVEDRHVQAGDEVADPRPGELGAERDRPDERRCPARPRAARSRSRRLRAGVVRCG